MRRHSPPEDYKDKRAECRELTVEVIGHHIKQQSTKDKQSTQVWNVEEVQENLEAANSIGKEPEQARREITGAHKSLKRRYITLHYQFLEFATHTQNLKRRLCCVREQSPSDEQQG